MTTSLPVAGVLLAVFLGRMLLAGGVAFDVRAVIALVFGALIVALSGGVVVLLVVRDRTPRLDLTILTGSIGTSLVLTVGCLLTGYRAGALFLCWSLVVLAAAATLSMRSKGAGAAKLPVLREVIAIAAIGFVVAFWCDRFAGLLPTLQSTGVAPAWSDYFIHATHIEQFARRLAPTPTAFLLAGQPLAAYHEAPYMLAAALASVVDVPALGLVATVLLPYGVLLASLGVYALVRTLAGPEQGVLVSVALLLVPDASTCGLQNGFLGFHWLLFTSPGSWYGLGVAFTALTFLVLWRTNCARGCFWLGLVLTLGLVLFRVQIFLLFALTLAATLACDVNLARPHARRLARAAVFGLGGVLFIAMVNPTVRETWLHFSEVETFISLVHTGQEPTAYDGVYRALEQRYGAPLALVAGFVTLVPALLGVLALAFPLALVFAMRRADRLPMDWFPLCSLLCWLGLVLVAPRGADGDITQYQHRPFVLVYAAVFVWSLIFLDRLVRRFGRLPRPRGRLLTLMVIAALAIVVAATLPSDPARPRFAWGQRFFDVTIDRGLLRASEFMRDQAAMGDRFAVIPVNLSDRAGDPATVLASLTNIPAHVAVPGYELIRDPSHRAVVDIRFRELQAIAETDDVGDAIDRLRRAGVTFLVVVGGLGPRFDVARSRAAWSAGRVSVYRIPRGPVEAAASGVEGANH